MKKVAVILSTLFVLTACGGNSPGKSEQQAINDVKEAYGISESVGDREVRNVLQDACDLMDDHRVPALVEELDMPKPLVDVVLDNATLGFCPEHRDEVVEYLEG